MKTRSRNAVRTFPRRRPWRQAPLLVLGLATASLGIGCDRGPDELLVAYSGNNQAYIEPCG